MTGDNEKELPSDVEQADQPKIKRESPNLPPQADDKRVEEDPSEQPS